MQRISPNPYKTVFDVIQHVSPGSFLLLERHEKRDNAEDARDYAQGAHIDATGTAADIAIYWTELNGYDVVIGRQIVT